jgi:hypothetical protein
VNGRRRQSARFRTVLLLGALALVPVGASCAASTNKVIGNGVRLKGTNVWYAHGKAVAPRTISVRVATIPAQVVKVQWSIVCQKPNRADPAVHLATLGKSGQVSVHAPATVKLALPYAKPPACIASVYATLGKSGKLTLRLTQS